MTCRAGDALGRIGAFVTVSLTVLAFLGVSVKVLTKGIGSVRAGHVDALSNGRVAEVGTHVWEVLGLAS